MSSLKWVGYAISVNCGEPLGHYQGTIVKYDGNTITLEKAFRNGFPYPKPQLTLKGADIKELKIIALPQEKTEPQESTVIIIRNKENNTRITVHYHMPKKNSSVIKLKNKKKVYHHTEFEDSD